jgi:hypothetical protein
VNGLSGIVGEVWGGQNLVPEELQRQDVALLGLFHERVLCEKEKGALREPNQYSFYPITSTRRRRTGPCICIRSWWDSQPSPAQFVHLLYSSFMCQELLWLWLRCFVT